MLQEYKQQSKDGLVQGNLYLLVSDAKETNTEYHRYWKNYVVKLSKALTAFLLALEDSYSHDLQSSASKPTFPVSSVYGELSVKWIMRVLLTVFPCIEACSNQNQLPNYLRWLIHLYVFWSILPLSLQFAGCSIVFTTISPCYHCFQSATFDSFSHVNKFFLGFVPHVQVVCLCIAAPCSLCLEKGSYFVTFTTWCIPVRGCVGFYLFREFFLLWFSFSWVCSRL